MQFSQLPTREASQRMAQAAVYIDRITENENVSSWYSNHIGKPVKLKELISLFRLVFSECYEDASQAIAILVGKSKEELDCQTLQQTWDEINEFAGGSILRFFSLSSSTAGDE